MTEPGMLCLRGSAHPQTAQRGADIPQPAPFQQQEQDLMQLNSTQTQPPVFHTVPSNSDPLLRVVLQGACLMVCPDLPL